MAGAIGPGDFVECIKPSERCTDVVLGGQYCVEALVAALGCCPACGQDDAPGLIFVGLPKRKAPIAGYLMSWCRCRFKPIDRPKCELLESLLTKADETISEDA